MKDAIDCVILWVDGSDPEWIAQKNKYSEKKNENVDIKTSRYRDWDTLKYLFRGIEMYAGWFRKVFLVTCGQIPDWIDASCPKLEIVFHDDFIPKQYLPTFNSNTIELNLHRIKELSNEFVYFNDDMFIMNKTKSTDFFKNGKPCDTAIFNAFAIAQQDTDFRFLLPVNNMALINRNFKKKDSIKKYFFKYVSPKYGKDALRTICLLPWRHFTGFTINHLPYSIRKSTLNEIWEREYDILDKTCSHRFRNSDDVNIWLATNWQFVKGDFIPRSINFGKYEYISDDETHNFEVYNCIKKMKNKTICINDDVQDGNYVEIKKNLIEAFESRFPQKSSFEK